MCDVCRPGLRRAPRRLVGEMAIVSAFIHEGPARQIVHHLKFGAVPAAADLISSLLIPLIPPCTALVPVPRSPLRRLRYGVDTADVIALGLGRRLRLPVVRALSADLSNRSHTGRSQTQRVPPRFHLRRPVPDGSLLIDDVLTTGSTLLAAGAVCGLTRAATFTVAEK